MKFPPLLIALDILGTLLIGFGLAERFGGVNLIPSNLRFPNDDITMIVVGAALMLPMLKFFIQHAAARRT